MRISTLRLAVLSSLAILSFSGAARAQSLETYPMSQVDAAPAPAARVQSATPVSAPSRSQAAMVGQTQFVLPPVPNTVKVGKRQAWNCQLPPGKDYAICSVKEWVNGTLMHMTTPLYYTYAGELIGYAPPQSQPFVATPRVPSAGEQIAMAQQNGTYAGGLKHEPQREMLVKRTTDGGVYAAEYDGTRPSFMQQVFGLGALILTEGLSQRIAYGSNGYYGGGYVSRSSNYNPSDRCTMGVGYTGPIRGC